MTTITRPASSKQTAFISKLFAEAAALIATAPADVQATVTSKIESVQPTLVSVLASDPVELSEASEAITALLAVTAALKASAPAPVLPVGLAALAPERVIVNKFAKDCTVCDRRVGAGEGHAILRRRTWSTICATCATTDPAEAQAAAQAAQAEALATVRAEADARLAADQAERAERGVVKALATDLFNRAGVADQARPDVHIAIASIGTNDLDFLRVCTPPSGAPVVYRILGGHSDQLLATGQAVAVLERAACTDSIVAAMAAYGREIGRCGRCHRSLTDEVSRSEGIGPECAKKLGF